jgi:hypothetical protein
MRAARYARLSRNRHGMSTNTTIQLDECGRYVADEAGPSWWRVQARAGGSEGVSQTTEVENEAAALELAQQWMAGSGDEWREMTVR